MQALQKLGRFVRKSPRKQWWSILSNLGETDWYWRIHSPGRHKTTYLVGLYGTGRYYFDELMWEHFGERLKYIRSGVRFRSLPTAMIYSGHATIRYPSRSQELPEVTSRILEQVRSGLADWIFVYRHPLDSLLSNWVWWRTYLRDRTIEQTIASNYKTTDALAAALEQNWDEFQRFAAADPAFYAGSPGPPFLSFSQFVEETELHLQIATLALRLEDCIVDPKKEFAKLAKQMSVDLDMSRLQVVPPHAAAYRFLAVKEKSPRFRDFIHTLDAETKRRITQMGYVVEKNER